MQFSSLAAFSALFAASAMGIPVEERMIEPPPPCLPHTSYNVTSKSPAPILGSDAKIIAMTCPGTGSACNLGTSESYSVSMSISVGLNLNLDPKAIQGNAGLSIGYTYATTKGNVDSATLTCPQGPWICGVSITPWVSQVSGFKITEMTGPCGKNAGKITADPYTVQFPQVIDNLPNVNAKICACPNADGADAPNAPPKCPQNC